MLLTHTVSPNTRSCFRRMATFLCLRSPVCIPRFSQDRPVQFCPAKPDRWERRLRGKNKTRPITKAAKVELAIEVEDGNCCYDGDAGDVSFIVPNVSVKI